MPLRAVNGLHGALIVDFFMYVCDNDNNDRYVNYSIYFYDSECHALYYIHNNT